MSNNQDNHSTLTSSPVPAISTNQGTPQAPPRVQETPPLQLDVDMTSDMELDSTWDNDPTEESKIDHASLSPRTTASCRTSSSHQATTNMTTRTNPTPTSNERLKSTLEAFNELRNKIAQLEATLASQKRTQALAERPIRSESDQRRHLDLSSTENPGHPLPSGRTSKSDSGITWHPPTSELDFSSHRQRKPTSPSLQTIPSVDATSFQSRSVATKPNLKYFTVDKFVPDNTKIDRGFRKWLTKFLQAISFAQEHANETWNERLKIHLLESKVTGIAEHWTESHRHEYQGKTLEETIEMLRKYMSSTITSETVTEFLHKCRKADLETWMEYMTKLLDIVNCKPGGLQNPDNVREALRAFLRNLSRMLKMGYVLGAVNANEGDPMVKFLEAVDYVTRVTNSDGVNYNSHTHKKRSAAEANLTQVDKPQQQSTNKTKPYGSNKRPKRDYSTALCKICNKTGHTTNYHIKNNLPGSWTPTTKLPQAEASLVEQDHPSASSSDESTNDTEDEAIHEAYIGRFG